MNSVPASFRIPATSVMLGLALCACRPAPLASASHEPTRGPSARYPHLCIDAIDGSPDLSDVTIKLTRGSGMGGTPDYRLELRGDGTGRYKGRAYVILKGRAEIEVARADLLAILDAFDELDFLDYEHDDDYSVIDAPGETISLTIGSRTRDFRNFECDVPSYETDRGYHASVAKIAELIDRSALVEQFTGTAIDRKVRFHLR